MEPSRHVDFERVTALASRLLRVPVCLVSLVDDSRQVFAGACGLPDPLNQERQTPLSHSFCKHAVRERRPLIIPDARLDPRVAENGAIADLGVIAYLGFPIHGPDDLIYGAFCVIDSKPRAWSEEDIGVVRDLTAIVVEQVELHTTKETERSSLDVLIHDLKTPLAGIRMVASLLQEKEQELPGSLRPLVGALGESTDSALKLVESLARRDRHSSGVCPDLSAQLADVVGRQEIAAEDKGLQILFDGSKSPMPVAAPDWVIEQVAENLLSNAIKFTPAGGRIQVSVSEQDGYGVFEVGDTGPGFAKEDYPKLFRRYSRMSAQPTAGEPSTGLGLSIVKRLVEQEGGSVLLLSRPGEGARFRVSFPQQER
ncbi:GAF domain-containing sensor histidine kinase [Luteolibacter marinus]|uniref:GAF domain-containing sensor histidine kinase n=1 Tax=Luteolibacter marinus TaxID=2776705 RepID=UPI001867C35C|nr:GAF domain-containing sensor histidine kinase [Luteolibacter marinus]